jgi:hypothetical protein
MPCAVCSGRPARISFCAGARRVKSSCSSNRTAAVLIACSSDRDAGLRRRLVRFALAILAISSSAPSPALSAVGGFFAQLRKHFQIIGGDARLRTAFDGVRGSQVLSKLSGEVVETQRDLTILVETVGCFSYLSWQLSMKCVAAPSAFVSTIHISRSALSAFVCCERGDKAVLEWPVTHRVDSGLDGFREISLRDLRSANLAHPDLEAQISRVLIC